MHTRTLNTLALAGLVIEDGHGWKLTAAGEREARSA
jgi:hypothetical protein